MMKILVTGFQPFNGRSVNPTELLLQKLQAPESVCLVKKLLPVEFRLAEKELRDIAEQEKPDVILSLGQAGNSPYVAVERVSINLDSCISSDGLKMCPDMSGAAPVDCPIIEGGADAYFATIPVISLVQKLNAEKKRARISYSAGTYVCNHIMYTGCELASHCPGMRSGFVHVPFLPEQLAGDASTEGKYSMPFSEMLQCVQEIVNLLGEDALSEA